MPLSVERILQPENPSSKKNREETYTMELRHGEQQGVIEKSLIERDLGQMVSSDLKWVTQVEKASKVAKALIT